jgi:hypothetical protein
MNESELAVAAKEEENKKINVVFIYYLFCPGGACPEGFWFSVSCCCVSPLPVQLGCWPPGWLPPPLLQDVSVVTEPILAVALFVNKDVAVTANIAIASTANKAYFILLFHLVLSLWTISISCSCITCFLVQTASLA